MPRARAAHPIRIEDLVDGASQLGLVYVDAQGLVLERSSYARELLKNQRGVQERGGRLTAERSVSARALRRLLGSASSGLRGEPVVVPEANGRCLVVHAIPVVAGGERDYTGGSGATACVILIDPWREITVKPETLMNVLGLTHGQSRVVASLVRGMTVSEIAEQTQRAPGSVRWHVKRALERTGTRRQSDLVRMAVAATSLRLADF